MNMQKLAKILLILFIILTIVSVLSIYYTYQLPTSETQTITLYTYGHTAIYNYTADLEPNIIYNKTTLKPNEGTLYTNIVEYLNITFNYTFTSTPEPINLTIQYQTVVQIKSFGKWERNFTAIEAQEILQLTNDLNFTLQISPKKIAEIVNQIDNETGISSPGYNINIRPTIHIIANTTSGNIDDVFDPWIAVAFKQDSTIGRYIVIEPLTTTKTERITETNQIPQPWVESLRTASIMFSIVSVSGLTLTTRLYLKNKPAKPKEKPITKIISPYKEIIAETTQKPLTLTTINVKTLEDMAKIAESLAKPILYLMEETEHTFYIIDGQITYQYKTTAPPRPSKRRIFINWR
ncbi:MAG: hypothetical protein H3Z53_03880 [archaeon]|nr:hypothetical protein [archaeon]